jgi:hypothetical protein
MIGAAMIDPRQEVVLIRNKERGGFDDKTAQVLAYHEAGNVINVTLGSRNGGRSYRYAATNVVVLGNPEVIAIHRADAVQIRGETIQGVTEILRFPGGRESWFRVFYSSESGDGYTTCPETQLRVTRKPEEVQAAEAVLDYWRDLAANLALNDFVRREYSNFKDIPADSALRFLLEGRPPMSVDPAAPVLEPFSSNISQRDALDMALGNRISVIDGPPGTGKTQTIVNLIANLVSVQGKTVGVASLNNAAVENVRDKLIDHGLGHIVADLGRQDKRDEFFLRQGERNSDLDAWLRGPVPEEISDEDLESSARQLRTLQETSRQLALWQQELDAFQLERDHFLLSVDRADLPELEGLSRLQTSGQVLRFLAETVSAPPAPGRLGKFIRRLRLRLRYGRLSQLDLGDSNTVLSLHKAFYDLKVAELEKQVEKASGLLASSEYARVQTEYCSSSQLRLEGLLRRRYMAMPRRIYAKETYNKQFADFTADYPVLLSTCHSLRRNVPRGQLLDYLIIDEASQVDLLVAGLALSCARNVVIVGDLKQLQHIATPIRAAKTPPVPHFDYKRHSILSAVIAAYGQSLPRTMLREHYRCDPAIIDFCNKKFYDGQLIPVPPAGPRHHPALVVVRTTAGNHMRAHSSGGRTNQREAEVIAQEVLRDFCQDVRRENIGVISPYRRQVDKITDALLERIQTDDAMINDIQADTVHKFQGREKEVVIMSTVVDETAEGHRGIQFVDDPNLVNVAVSRATKRFVLVTNYDMVPESRHLRDLVLFIRYSNPGEGVVESTVVSVFDLLYREYSAVLQPLADRLKKDSAFASENIIHTVLSEILTEAPFTDLALAPQVLLKSLLRATTALTPEHISYINNGATFDIVIYNRITRQAVLAVEVDGFEFHENNAVQRVRDAHKNAICSAHGLPLLRLATTGSSEEARIRQALSHALDN